MIRVANAPVSYGAFEITVGHDPNVPDGISVLDQVAAAGYAGIDLGPVGYLGSGTRQGFGIYSQGAEAVHSRGAWGQITVRAAKRLDIHLFTGQVDDRDEDLNAGSIGRNLLFGANSYFHLAPNVLLGLEASQVRTEYLGKATRLNNHYDLALAYIF